MPNHIQESPHIAIELEGYEALIDLRAKDDHLSTEQQLFVDQLKERRRTQPSPFSMAFDATCLMERLGSTHERDPELGSLCQRGLELLAADATDLVLASRRVCDAAERVLARNDPRDAHTRKLALGMRDAARKTQQLRFDRILADIAGHPAGSAERANGLRAHAIALATAFGIHRGPPDLGADFILDAEGHAAYAFQRLTPESPAALAWSRQHARLALLLSIGNGEKRFYMGGSASELVKMPGRWCEPAIAPEATLGAALNPFNDPELICETAGLLTPAPEGFRLPLSDEGSNKATAEERLAKARFSRPGAAPLQRLLLTAMCSGVTRPNLDAVLIDPNGAFWILDHVAFLAMSPLGETPSRVQPHQAPALQTPLADSLLQWLAALSGDLLREPLKKRCAPTDRETALLGEAEMECGQALRPWPSGGDIDRACEAMQTVSDWARHAQRASRRLAKDDSPDERLREAVAKQCSLEVLAASLQPEGEAD